MANINNEGIEIIKRFEGLRTKAYRCAGGAWTLGYGHTKGVRRGDMCTIEQADRWLLEDIGEAERAVGRLVKVPLTENQFAALVSFTFNVGPDEDKDVKPEGLGDSTLLKKLNRGDYAAVPNELKKWNKAGGRVKTGLVLRRAAEAALWSKPD